MDSFDSDRESTLDRSESALTEQPATRSCRFCEFNSHDSDLDLDSPWLVGQEFTAVVTKGALVEGWSLICPTEHELNLAQRYKTKSFWEFADRAISVVTARYGVVSIFEHGANKEHSDTACGSNHAHLHVVPLPFGLAGEAAMFDASRHWIRCHAHEIIEIAGAEEYLFVADSPDGAKTTGYLNVLTLPTSQFFRRVVAHKLGKDSYYDYKQHPFVESGLRSRKLLAADVSAWGRDDRAGTKKSRNPQ